jgi:Zn-finger protein
MINNCPNCGFSLQQELNDGISHCKNCNAVFNSNVFNEILSAAWQLRRQNISLDKLEWQTKLDKDLVNFVYYFVSILGYSHDELLKMLKKFQNN